MAIENTLFLIGRVIIALFYGMTSVAHFMQLENMTAHTKSKGVPFPKLAVLGSSILLLVIAVTIGFAFYPLIGIITSVIFYIGVTPVMHSFWKIEDAMQKQSEMAAFMKNMALMAASLIFIAIDGWSSL